MPGPDHYQQYRSERVWERVHSEARETGLEVLLQATAPPEERSYPQYDSVSGVLVVDSTVSFEACLWQLALGLGLHVTLSPKRAYRDKDRKDAEEWATAFLEGIDEELEADRQRARQANPDACIAVKRDGQPCRATRISGSDYCHSHHRWYTTNSRRATI